MSWRNPRGRPKSTVGSDVHGGPGLPAGANLPAGAGNGETAEFEADVARGLREFRLEGVAVNPMYPAALTLLASAPGYLSVRVVIQNPDAPGAPPLDAVYEFGINQYGALTVRDPLLGFSGMRYLPVGTWEMLNGLHVCEECPFMWCIRQGVEGGQPGPLTMWVRWLTGRYAWRE